MHISYSSGVTLLPRLGILHSFQDTFVDFVTRQLQRVKTPGEPAFCMFLRDKIYYSTSNALCLRTCDRQSWEFEIFKSPWWSAVSLPWLVSSLWCFPPPDSPRKLLPTEQVHTEQVGSYVGGLRAWSLSKLLPHTIWRQWKNGPEHAVFRRLFCISKIMSLKVKIQNAICRFSICFLFAELQI